MKKLILTALSLSTLLNVSPASAGSYGCIYQDTDSDSFLTSLSKWLHADEKYKPVLAFEKDFKLRYFFGSDKRPGGREIFSQGVKIVDSDCKVLVEIQSNDNLRRDVEIKKSYKFDFSKVGSDFNSFTNTFYLSAGEDFDLRIKDLTYGACNAREIVGALKYVGIRLEAMTPRADKECYNDGKEALVLK